MVNERHGIVSGETTGGSAGKEAGFEHGTERMVNRKVQLLNISSAGFRYNDGAVTELFQLAAGSSGQADGG